MPRKKKNTAETATNVKETVTMTAQETEKPETEEFQPFVPFEPETENQGAQKPIKGETFQGVSPFQFNKEGEQPLCGWAETLTECQTLRPNGETCLQELENVKAKPNQYSYDAKNAVLSFKNLCAFCKHKVRNIEE